MIESLEKLNETKVKLSVPLIASFITKRHFQGQKDEAVELDDDGDADDDAAEDRTGTG